MTPDQAQTISKPNWFARLAQLLRELGPQASRDSGRSLHAVCLEQLALRLLNGMSLSEYCRYHLYDPALSWKEKRQFVSGKESRGWWFALNPPEFEWLVNNKLILKRILLSAGVPTPRLHAVYDPVAGETADGRPFRTAEDIAAWIERDNIRSFVVKPMASRGGRMVRVLDRVESTKEQLFQTPKGETYDPAGIVAFLHDENNLRHAYPYSTHPPLIFLFEQRCRNHPDLLPLSRKTVCGMRICTVFPRGEEPKLLAVTLKVSLSDGGLDNRSQDGLIADVNPEDGRVRAACSLDEYWTHMHSTHPVTHAQIEGMKVPYVREAVDTALRAQALFPMLQSIGWDIPVTENGPVILEGNTRWNLGFTQFTTHKGMKQSALVPIYEEARLRREAKKRRRRPARIIARVAGLPGTAFRFTGELLTRGRVVARESGVSLWRLAREQLTLYRRYKLHRSEYYWYRLHDPKLSWEEKKAYIGGRAAIRYWSRFNPKRYWAATENKRLFSHTCSAARIPHAELYGVFDPERGTTAGGASLRNADDLRNWIEQSGVSEFVLKPMNSSQGNLILVLRRDPTSNMLTGIDGKQWTPEALVRHMTDEENLRIAYPGSGPLYYEFLVEERLRPHPEIARLSGSETLCTCRVLSLLPLGRPPELVTALFKLQPHDAGVDNTSRGAMAVHIDIESGRLGEGTFMYLKGYRLSPQYRQHPDGGEPFYGQTLPMWPDLVETVKRTAAAFPMLRCMGWDVALTTRGPVIVEGNVRWGVESLQLAAGRGLAQGRLMEVFQELAGVEGES